MVRRVLGSVAPAMAIIAAACSSFGDGEAAPGPDADAASPPSDAGDPPDAADANADPCEGYVAGPAPSDPIHVDCGPGASDVDTTTNSKHCGACGHDCLSSVCSASTCVPETVVELGGSNVPRPVTIAPPHIYFANDWRRWELFRASISALAPASYDLVVTSTADGGSPGPSRYFISGHVADDVAWLRGNSVLFKAQVNDAGPSVPTEVAELPQSLDGDTIAVGTNAVYAIQEDRIVAFDRATNAKSDVVGLPPGKGRELAVPPDGSEIFWITDNAVFRKRGADEARLTDIGDPRSLRIDDVYIYWVDVTTDTVHRLRRDADAGATPIMVTTLSDATSNVHRALFVTGGYIYFLTGAVDGATTGTVVRRVHRCGGDPLTLSPLFGSPNALRVDGAHVYYGNGSLIRRVAR